MPVESVQLNLHETDLLFQYLSHHLTWQCSRISDDLQEIYSISSGNRYPYLQFIKLGNWKQQSNLGGKYGNVVQPLFEKCLSLFKKAFLNQKKVKAMSPSFSHLKKGYFTLKKRLSHFLKKVTSTIEKAFLHNKKRFSREKKVIRKKEKKCFSTHRR